MFPLRNFCHIGCCWLFSLGRAPTLSCLKAPPCC